MAGESAGGVQVEGIYAIGTKPKEIADPGDAGAIDVTRSGYVLFVSGGAETRTLADPTFIGQEIDLFFKTDGGDCVVAAASPVNQTGNNTITFADVGDHQRLVGQWNATDGWEWREIANDGAALTTV